MANTKHYGIRAAIANLFLVGDPPLAAGNVFENRDYALAEGVATQIHVNRINSQPEQIQITGATLPVAAKDRRVARSPATAGAAITRSFVATVANPSSGATPAGSVTPGRNASLTRRPRIAAASPSSRAHS